MHRQYVGEIDSKVVSLLSLNANVGTPIFIGDGNVAHIIKEHPDDYALYGSDIEYIIRCPDYVGYVMNDGSLEYVKEYPDGYVKVSVRIAKSGQYYVRSLYTLNRGRVNDYIAKGTLKKYKTVDNQ